MNFNFPTSILIIVFLFSTVQIKAQSTFSRVKTIVQNNCVNSCHNGVDHYMDFSGTEDDLYGVLTTSSVSNATAAAKGNKIIKPGYPNKSFLLRKIDHGLEPDRNLESTEGLPMPLYSTPLEHAEIELISSWILHGAPKTGTPVEEQAIIDYYNGKGMQAMERPPAPNPSEGFQIHFGSLYLGPTTEKEFFKKESLDFITDTLEITRLESFINGESHHFIMYKFDQAADSWPYAEGLRYVGGSNGFTNAEIVAGWQFSDNLDLPTQTAFFWEPGTVLDLNYHFLNYSQDSILKVELYTNVYYNQKQPGTIQMHANLLTNTSLFIPNDGQEHSFSQAVYNPNSNDSIYVWLMNSHTHKYGKDYDIYLRNTDGSKGDQIYEGYYNYELGFDQGYYDWAHPSSRYWEPLLAIHERDGIIQEAKFLNNGPNSVIFGLTTTDEMMLSGIHYTRVRPSDIMNGLQSTISNDTKIRLKQNPVASGQAIQLLLPDAKWMQNITTIQLYNSHGAIITDINLKKQNNTITLSPRGTLSRGLYLISIKGANFNQSLKTYIVNQ